MIATTLESHRTVTIGRDATEVFELWRRPGVLAVLFEGLAEVTESGPDRATWRLTPPHGPAIEWETHVDVADPPHRLAWRSSSGPAAGGELTLRPAPRELGTEATLRLDVSPPGAVGAIVARVVGTLPNGIASTVVRRLKSLAETGEIPTLENNPSGRREPVEAEHQP